MPKIERKKSLRLIQSHGEGANPQLRKSAEPVICPSSRLAHGMHVLAAPGMANELLEGELGLLSLGLDRTHM